MKPILLATATLLSMTCCNLSQPSGQDKTIAPKTMPNLKHKQALVVHVNKTSGGSMTLTTQDLGIDSLYVEKIRKENKDSLYKHFSLADSPSCCSYIKISLKDMVTGEEVILAEK